MASLTDLHRMSPGGRSAAQHCMSLPTYLQDGNVAANLRHSQGVGGSPLTPGGSERCRGACSGFQGGTWDVSPHACACACIPALGYGPRAVCMHVDTHTSTLPDYML